MALENQIYLYSVDTGNFYTAKERFLHDKNAKIRGERRKIADEIEKLKQELLNHGYFQKDLNRFTNEGINPDDVIGESYDILVEYTRLVNIKRMKTKAANKIKDKLLLLLANKMNAKERVNLEKHPDYQYETRVLNEETVSEKNIISLFESSLTRMMGLKKDDFTEDLMVVQVYYFDIFKDMSYYGFTYKGEKYKYYTSSAGQIRKKKAVFIKESVWDKYEKTIMCGLTIDEINQKGGNNVNKHLAYMALTNSATDEWTDFDIDRTIVIDDFETNVFGEYDLISDDDYSIKRTTGEVPIPHTDGAGMALFGQNRMFRAPWVKGLLGVFDFRAFIIENRERYHDESIGVIKDIYGQEHDIIAENIYVIFTKSQFKMEKYYDSWDEYKDYFKKYNCKAGVCNVEERRISNSKINYQELQTLTDMTDDELMNFAQPSIDRLNNICSSVENMQAIFGVTPYNHNMLPLQEAVKIYPDLMNDTFFKDMLKSIKDSLIKKYKSGKLEVNGKYTFLLPDFYAACEHWFLHIENPNGLLADNETFCWLYRKADKLDCLRSPHLYKEHAVRPNVASKGIEDKRVKEIRRWFSTNAVYTSSHDLISKVLQFDVDGDKSLIIADKEFIRIAERNMQGIVPLYYNMRKAKPTELNAANIYKGLNAAFTGSNIGTYSNNITKIWNSDIFISGTDEEKQHAVDIVKLLCMENNFCIDFAKTLYKPERPKHIDKAIRRFTGKKVPHFFIYAKDNEYTTVEDINDSLMNKLDKIIPSPRINTRKLGLKPVNYKLMMKNPDIMVDEKLIARYEELNNHYHFRLTYEDMFAKGNLRYVFLEIKEDLAKFGYRDDELADMFVKYLYEKPNRKRKALVWYCYGANIVENLKNNGYDEPKKDVECSMCGIWFEVSKFSNAIRCPECQREYRRMRETQRVTLRRKENDDNNEKAID